ncbi:MAG: hypothetical protein AAGA66_15975 [Bacteroidota bacterium]
MKSNFYTFLIVLTGIFTLSSCSNDDVGDMAGGDEDLDPLNAYVKDGYYISTSLVADQTTFFGTYSAEFPTAAVDVRTVGTSFAQHTIRGVRDGFLYGSSLELNKKAITKFGIDTANFQLTVLGEIGLDSDPSNVSFINDSVAVVGTFDTQDVIFFNPITMELIKDVDMSGAKRIEENEINAFSSMSYNPVTGKVYAPLYTNDKLVGGTPQFYDADKVYVEVIDATTMTREKTISHDNAQYLTSRGAAESVVDEEGNLYLIAQGQYGLDGQVGPTAAVASRPQLLKITTDSEFDESFAYNPVNDIGLLANNFFQILSNVVYGANNKAYGICTVVEDFENTELLQLIGKFGNGSITEEETDRLTQLILFTDNMGVIEIDLAAKTSKIVEGTEKTAGYWFPRMHNWNGKVYAQQSSLSSNGFYEIDPATGAASLKVDIPITNGIPYGFFDLAASFD